MKPSGTQHPTETNPSGTRMTGTVKRLVMDKNFGFIRHDASGAEYFFHSSEVRGIMPFTDLREGDQVTFFPTKGDKGPRASQVEAVGPAGEGAAGV